MTSMIVEASWCSLEMVTASLGLFQASQCQREGMNWTKHALGWPSQRKLRLGDSRSMVEHLDEVGAFDCRVPLLPELRGRDNGFPSVKRGRFICGRHIEKHSIHVLTRLRCLPVDDDVRQVWVWKHPWLSFWWCWGVGGKRNMFPVARVV